MRRGETTHVTSHRLLARLEQEELMELDQSDGGRRVRDVGGLRRWLAANARPGRTKRLACFVPEESLARAAYHPELVLTGAVAAERLGLPVLTSIPRHTFRVVAEGEQFEEMPASLGGFRTDSGANMVIISDPDRLGFLDLRVLDDGTRVAPPSRVMLDLLFEPRGEAAAGVFLDLWADRQVG